MSNKEEQQRKAEEFLALHHAPQILVLPNAWEVTSAKIFESEGFKAIATTSAGVANVLGFADGQHMGIDDNAAMVGKIAQHVNLPVSADIEAGYSDSIEGIVKSAEKILDVGAVGINLEDGTGDPSKPLVDQSLMVERIRAIREMADAHGIHLVINARTDVFLVPEEEGEGSSKLFKQAVERGNAYKQAGADCIYTIETYYLDKEGIARIVNEIEAPINILASAGKPTIAQLEEIGVARVSLGPRVMRAALGLIRKISKELLTTGTYDLMTTDTLTAAETNGWFR
ncbi:MAG: isocitrate lyase/phosphoenolpyruvate mutase family protein [bacterium]|nr:isocitrate lyase/phosphoenolpyruvate mutase family protein [bacterium]